MPTNEDIVVGLRYELAGAAARGNEDHVAQIRAQLKAYGADEDQETEQPADNPRPEASEQTDVTETSSATEKPADANGTDVTETSSATEKPADANGTDVTDEDKDAAAKERAAADAPEPASKKKSDTADKTPRTKR